MVCSFSGFGCCYCCPPCGLYSFNSSLYLLVAVVDVALLLHVLRLSLSPSLLYPPLHFHRCPVHTSMLTKFSVLFVGVSSPSRDPTSPIIFWFAKNYIWRQQTYFPFSPPSCPPPARTSRVTKTLDKYHYQQPQPLNESSTAPAVGREHRSRPDFLLLQTNYLGARPQTPDPRPAARRTFTNPSFAVWRTRRKQILHPRSSVTLCLVPSVWSRVQQDAEWMVGETRTSRPINSRKWEHVMCTDQAAVVKIISLPPVAKFDFAI